MQTPIEIVRATRERLARESKELFIPLDEFNAQFESGNYRDTPQWRQAYKNGG